MRLVSRPTSLVRARAARLAWAACLVLGGCASRGSTGGSDPPVVPAEPSHAPALREHPDPLPLLAMDGSLADLRDLAAPVTVVSLWATFCGPCVEKLPTMEALHREHEDDPRIRIVMVNVDSLEEHDRARALLAEHAPTIPAYFDPNGTIWEWLKPTNGKGDKIRVLPLLAIIDLEGQIHRRVSMEKDRSGTSFEQVVDGALAGSMPPSLPNIFKQMNPSLPPPRPGMKMVLEPDLTPEEIDDVLERMERIYRQDPDFTDEVIEQRLRELRRRIEAGERQFEPDFSKPEGSEP